MNLLLQGIGGLQQAMFLFLLAAGLSLIFGVSRIINISHGAFYAIGAYLVVLGTRGGALGPFSFLLLVLGIGVATGVLGALFEIAVLRRVYRGGMLIVALVTYGALVVTEETIKIVFTGGMLAVPKPVGLNGEIPLGQAGLPTYSLMLLVAGLVLAVLLWLVVEHTALGLKLRAAALDREMLAVLGKDVPLLYTATFALGSLLAGVAGALAAPMQSIVPGMGSDIIIEAFAVVVIGGLGSLPGSLVGALIVGETQAFGVLVAPESTLMLLYGLMAAILVLRPQGLLGTALN
jgi:branched-subunit amino acid ABC-type transport system permease component